MNWTMKLRIGWAILGITAGLMAGTVFGFQYHNWLTLVIGYFSSVCAA
uniref:Uncharacterized protein n=1 Tax=Acrobeloides nanus TaxID=290746 RepID=A0A914D7D3_9BILA